MTNAHRAPNTVLSANVLGLPHPELPCMTHGAALPPPVGLLPNVADSGRICFGAGMRLRTGR